MRNKSVEFVIDELFNLYPACNNSYRPVGEPRIVGAEGWNLLCPLSEGRVVASRPGITAVIDAGTMQTSTVGTSTAHCAGVAAGGTLIVMTDDGPETYDADAGGGIAPGSGGTPEWSPMAITAESTDPLTMHTDAVELSREYGPGDPMTMADRNALGVMMSKVYSETCVQAQIGGVFFEPLMARAVVRDNNGSVLHRGPLLLIMPPGGTVFDSAVRLPATTGHGVDGCDLTIPTYRLRVNILPMAAQQWCERAARVDIEVSPCFLAWKDAADTSPAEANMVRNGTSGLAVMVRVPGSEHCLSAHNTARNSRLVAAMTAHFDRSATILHSIARPFEHGIDAVVTADGMAGQAAQTEALRRIANTRPGVGADLMRHCINAPHTFTSRIMATAPAAVAYGGVTPLLYPGYTPFDYAASFEDTGDETVTWSAMTTVTFADGTVSRRFCQATGPVPAELNPLLTYPHPDARAIDIVLEDDRGGELPRTWHADLRPAPDGLNALGLSEISAARTPAVDTDAWLHDTATVRRPSASLTGVMAVAPAARPLCITATVDAGLPVTAITPARSTAAAWDFGRTRFYVFTDRSTLLANVSTALDTISTGVIAQTGAPGPAAVTTDAASATYFIGGSRSIYRIDGSRVDRLADSLVDIDVLGYDRRASLLVAGASSGGGVLSHYDATTGAFVTTTSSPGPMDCMVSVGARLLAPTQDGLADLAIGSRVPDVDETTPVAMRCSVAAASDSKGRRPAGVIWHIESAAFDGSLSVSRRYLSADRTARIAGYNVVGRLATPLRMPLLMRPAAGALVEISATVSSDTLILKPCLS